MNASRSNLILGTANLGTQYGVANEFRFNPKESKSIIESAIAYGIKSFDTAPDYGLAEELLGHCSSKNADLNIFTKIPKMEKYSLDLILDKLNESLKTLRRESIYGIYFHEPEIYRIFGIKNICEQILATGKVKHIGVSVYSEKELCDAKEEVPSMDIFQIPENILDQRLVNSNRLLDLKRNGTQIYVRSVFLQGLLLMPVQDIPSAFKTYTPQLENLKLAAENAGVSPLDLCLSYANSLEWSSGTLIAVATQAQLRVLMDYKFIEIDSLQISTLPESILDPRKWSTKR